MPTNIIDTHGNQQAKAAKLPSSDYLVIMGALKLQKLLGDQRRHDTDRASSFSRSPDVVSVGSGTYSHQGSRLYQQREVDALSHHIQLLIHPRLGFTFSKIEGQCGKP